MLIIGKNKVWRPLSSAPGVSLLVSPLQVDERAAAYAAVALVEDPQARARAYSLEVARRCLHDWKGVGALDANGKPVPVPCTDEHKEAFACDVLYNDELHDLVTGLGTRFHREVDAAGNGLSGSSTGSAKAARGRKKSTAATAS